MGLMSRIGYLRDEVFMSPFLLLVVIGILDTTVISGVQGPGVMTVMTPEAMAMSEMR